MDKLLDTVEAELTCGQCGRMEKHPVSWLIQNTTFVCPMCGDEVDLTSPEWQSKIQTYIDACASFDA